MRLIHVTNKVHTSGTMSLHLSIEETIRQNFTARVKEEPQSRLAMT